MWLLVLVDAFLRTVSPPAPPSFFRITGVFQRPGLRESSGIAVSRSHRGVLWTHNDSGDGPFVYATDTAGKDLGTWRVSGASATDWEDIAIGPCPSFAGWCLYIADTGDNGEARPSVTVYAVPEPTPSGERVDSARATAPAEALQLTYTGGPSDVEAIYVTADATLFLVTKGRSRGVRLLQVARGAWQAAGPVAAAQIQRLPIEPDQRIGRWVTGAAVSPDGAKVVVRTYSELYIFTPENGGALGPEPIVCWLGPSEPQGEAVDFLNSSTLVTTSEAPHGVTGTIYLTRCP